MDVSVVCNRCENYDDCVERCTIFGVSFRYKSSQTLCFQGLIKLLLLNCVRFCLSKDCVTRRRSNKKPNLHLKWMETWMKRKNEIWRKPVLSMFSGSGSHLLSGRPAVRIRSRTPLFRGFETFRGPCFHAQK